MVRLWRRPMSSEGSLRKIEHYNYTNIIICVENQCFPFMKNRNSSIQFEDKEDESDGVMIANFRTLHLSKIIIQPALS